MGIFYFGRPSPEVGVDRMCQRSMVALTSAERKREVQQSLWYWEKRGPERGCGGYGCRGFRSGDSWWRTRVVDNNNNGGFGNQGGQRSPSRFVSPVDKPNRVLQPSEQKGDLEPHSIQNLPHLALADQLSV
ncbi:UNVERIFIED_CONTAM: hypothetical protein Slati_3965400 [Sesamum latifolium]|uniref:Uncharacterized protein n=1 Tax=Sesamum latifolium TaxID=2727402 RepID=A0AAW2TPZ1_9LAMI